jgi:hypothetical protein
MTLESKNASRMPTDSDVMLRTTAAAPPTGTGTPGDPGDDPITQVRTEVRSRSHHTGLRPAAPLAQVSGNPCR